MTLKEFLKLSNFGPIHTMFLDKHSGEIFTMDETDEAFLKRDMNLSKKLVDMSISDQIQYLNTTPLKRRMFNNILLLLIWYTQHHSCYFSM